MFLAYTLLVFFIIYSISAFLAETIFTSPNEQKIPISTRVGLGYFLSLFYFVSAWLFMSIRQAWCLGLILLALYICGKTSKGLLALEWKSVKGLLKKHFKILCVFLLLANLFFLPLHLSGNYGPFSEGGGDVTIYSDTAKRLADFNLNAVGLEENASFKDRLDRIKELINKDHIQDETYGDMQNIGDYMTQGQDLINPPNANYQANRLAFNFIQNPIQFTPCAQFAFLSGKTNYPIFFALLAFLYSLILASAWGFFCPYGRIPAVISVLIIGGSNGLVSGFYNMYLLQAMSITILVLTLVAVNSVSLFSVAGLRVYGFGSLFILMSYQHFLPLIAPLLVLASITLFYKKSGESEISNPENKNRFIQDLLHYSPLIIFFSFCIAEIFAGYRATVDYMKITIAPWLTNEISGGKSVLGFSDQWWTFLFGLASQQHFYPYATEHDTMNSLFLFGAYLGLFLLATSFLLIISYKFLPVFSQKQKKEIWHHIGIYLALAIVICIYSMMIQKTLYIQAKGAQYLLIYIYFLMLLPLTIFYKAYGPIKVHNLFKNKEKNRKIVFTTTFFVFFLFIFSAFLWVPRVIYSYRIGHHKDRSTVIEASFFSQAERIKAEDENAFVLFEPRTSADVYFPYQSFAGYKLIPSRHLVLDQIIPADHGGTGSKALKIPSDFLKHADINHLWSLTAVKEGKGKYQWKTKKMVYKKDPDLIFSGYDYQRDFSIQSRSKRNHLISGPKERGIFSYIRNGAVMIYLPPGGPFHLDVRIFNRDGKDKDEFDLMAVEIEKQVKSGELRYVSSMQKKDGIINLLYDFNARSIPRIEIISKYSSEYWFNARLDGKEMQKD